MDKCHLLFYLLCLKTGHGGLLVRPESYQIQNFSQDPAIEKFREYLRIDTSKPENLKPAVEFWRREALESGLEFAVYEPAGKPICVLTWRGTDPALPSIMLNSHMDVVAVQPEDWTYPPFAAHMDEYEDIYARGAQDTKDLPIQQIEAIRRLKNENMSLLRTVHITLIPDEETGSFQGMIPFLKTKEFENLNVGFALDEGITSTVENTIYATYVDKRPWQMNFTVYGISGHGSTMPDDSAMEKLERLIKAISSYRKTQKCLQKSGQPYWQYNNLNINIVKGGLAPNIVPGEMSLTVDIRLSVLQNATKLQEIVQSWVNAAGNGTQVEFLRRIDESVPTPVGDTPYWNALTKSTSKLGLKVSPVVCPATSDMIYLRPLGIPALGFAPKLNTTSRIHGANEYLNAATFINGIEVYYEVIKELGNLKTLEFEKDKKVRNKELNLSEISNLKPRAASRTGTPDCYWSKSSTKRTNYAVHFISLITLLAVNQFYDSRVFMPN